MYYFKCLLYLSGAPINFFCPFTQANLDPPLHTNRRKRQALYENTSALIAMWMWVTIPLSVSEFGNNVVNKRNLSIMSHTPTNGYRQTRTSMEKIMLRQL